MGLLSEILEALLYLRTRKKAEFLWRFKMRVRAHTYSIFY